ncbi:MAG: NAD-dependent epimerase/dehydratase family protein [Bryobacteraceae bacterium]|nr:NAD-dependent epimerase/dehydratase family protein [Bryobacteraceae bacterium]
MTFHADKLATETLGAEATLTQFSLAGRNVLVWGGLGFLGSHLVDCLLSAGASVRLLTRERERYTQPTWAHRVQWFEVRHESNKQEVFRSAVNGVDLVYNFAGSSGAVASNSAPLASLENNCREQLLFLAACEESGTCPHVVFSSSWLVYGRPQYLPVDESHPLEPCSMYGAHKACIENYLRIFATRGKIRFSVVRMSNPYGFDPTAGRTSYKLLNTFVNTALAGHAVVLFGDGSQLRDFIYVSDVARALVACGQRAEATNEILNLSSGQSHTLLEAVNLLREMVPSPPPMFREWPPEYVAAEPGSYIADVSKMQRVLGLSGLVDLREGLSRTIGLLEASREQEMAVAPAAS